ncbi:putative minor tail protein [Vibrio phage phiKT1028]|nr:putative minor tail protein [Vibrio phage phiKT1028]
MNLPEVKQFRLDVSGKSKENLIPRELVSANDELRKKIIVPRYAPFFILSVQVFAVGSPTPLVLDEDYDFISIDNELSEYAGAPVSWVLRKLKTDLPDLEITYQTMGTVPALTDTTKSWYTAAALDQRPVWFDQIMERPEQYIPQLHSHDLATGFYYFQRLVRYYQDRLDTLFGTSEMIPYRDWFLGQLSNLESYMLPFRTLLNYYTGKHYSHKKDPHGTTSRKVPGLELIDPVKTATLGDFKEKDVLIMGMYPAKMGPTSSLRTVSGHATKLIEEAGLNPEDHTIPQFEERTFIGDETHLKTDRIAYGLGDLKVSCWVGRDGKGRGMAEFWDEKGSVINHIINHNPLGLSSSVHPNRWINTHKAFKADSLPYPATRMIPGGNAHGSVFFSDNQWYFLRNRDATIYGFEEPYPLTPSNDFNINWKDYHLTVLGDNIWLTRTSDYTTKPTVVWYLIKTAAGRATMESYTFVYNTVSDGAARSETAKVNLFSRGFQSGKYSSGDLVFSKGVDLVDLRQRITLLPAMIGGQLYVEFMLPESFKYNGETRHYTHSHMAKCIVNDTNRRITLQWTDTRPRPYIQTDLLFLPTPDANNYFEQVATPFPTSLSNHNASIVMMEEEGFFGFGYRDLVEGGTFSYTFMPQLYEVELSGRAWNLDGGSPWETGRCGARIVEDLPPLDVNHPGGLQPYCGVMAESEEDQRMTLLKSWNREGKRAWFVKTGYYNVRDKNILGAVYSTTGQSEEISEIRNMDNDLTAGSFIGPMGSRFFLTTLNSESDTDLAPVKAIVDAEAFHAFQYAQITDSFLSKFPRTPTQQWTLVIGKDFEMPNLLYIDDVLAGVAKTTVYSFSFNSAVFDRIDAYHGETPVTVLTDQDAITIHNSRVVQHNIPTGIRRALVENPEVGLHAGSINVYRNNQGVFTVSLNPKTRVGDVYEYVNLPTTVTLAADKTVSVLVSESYSHTYQNLHLTDRSGWMTTNIEQQTSVKGLLNPSTRHPSLPSIPGQLSVDVMAPFHGLMNVDQKLYVPPNILVGEHRSLRPIDWLTYDFRSDVPASGTVEYDIYLCFGHEGPYLRKVPTDTFLGDAIHITMVTLDKNGIVK